MDIYNIVMDPVSHNNSCRNSTIFIVIVVAIIFIILFTTKREKLTMLFPNCNMLNDERTCINTVGCKATRIGCLNSWQDIKKN